METRSCGFFAFRLHVVAAADNDEIHTGQLIFQHLRSNPFIRLVAVVIVAFQRDYIGADKVIIGTAAVLIFCTHMVKADSFFHIVSGSNHRFIRIYCILRFSGIIGSI